MKPSQEMLDKQAEFDAHMDRVRAKARELVAGGLTLEQAEECAMETVRREYRK